MNDLDDDYDDCIRCCFFLLLHYVTKIMIICIPFGSGLVFKMIQIISWNVRTKWINRVILCNICVCYVTIIALCLLKLSYDVKFNKRKARDLNTYNFLVKWVENQEFISHFQVNALCCCCCCKCSVLFCFRCM